MCFLQRNEEQFKRRRKRGPAMPTPEERIAEVAPNLLWRRPGIITDPIWMEYAIAEVDPSLRSQLSAVRLETVAAVYRSIAEGAANAAQVLTKQAATTTAQASTRQRK
jgi:hypothetical protein